MARSQGLALPSGNRGLLIIAALAGLAAAVLFVIAASRSDSGGSSGGTNVVDGTVKVVVAKDNIDAGTKIDAGMLEVRNVPEDLIVAGAFSDTVGVVDEVTRVEIRQGEQVTDAKIGPLVTGEGLGYVVPSGKRAISLQVVEVTAVGGLLLAGDRVDVLGAFEIRGEPGLKEGEHILRVRTILQSVEVLSVAQEKQEAQRAADANADGDGSRDVQTSGNLPEDIKEQPGAATVTLALTPEEVQQLISAQETAKRVWTSLRPAGEEAPVDVPAYDIIVTD
ncbi:MAG TPA: Flp pilus assembly protein CpaB [Dehalococcoidia bacterium]|jgi:pilus assembly protein CpaB|nr:Flp pilus assembly protein CpaB [Dehalococcoidia bacterium]